VEVYPDPGCMLALAEQDGCFPAEILLCGRNLESTDIDFRFPVIKYGISGEDLEHIAELQGVEDGFDIVVSVPAFPENVQSYIDLGIRKGDHYTGLLTFFPVLRILLRPGNVIVKGTYKLLTAALIRNLSILFKIAYEKLDHVVFHFLTLNPR
jgi:hypothetical protein